MSRKKPNIAVASNVWISIENPVDDHYNNPTAASKSMPGDLALRLIVGSTDSRQIDQAILDRRLTKRQLKEYLSFRFFMPHNHIGDQWVGPPP